MPTKRQVLEQLKRDELIAAVERFELPVADRRVRDLLIAALASSRKATLPKILADFKRARLKELCRGLGLDDGGREKALIVDRLAGTGVAKSGASARQEPVQASLLDDVGGSMSKSRRGMPQPTGSATAGGSTLPPGGAPSMPWSKYLSKRWMERFSSPSTTPRRRPTN